MMRKIRKIMKDNAGFTLVELIVVMVIIGIMLSGVVSIIINYQKYSMYKKNNEYAQSIFVAAQATLTHYKASGELEEFSSKVETYAENSKDETCGKIGDIWDNWEWDDPETEEAKGGIKKNEKDRLYYLMIQSGKHDETNTPSELLYQLLSNNVFDDVINAGTICVELDPVDGVVKSVLYTDRAEIFTYLGDNPGSVTEIGGVRTMNIRDRREAMRRDIILGYYGDGTGLSEASPVSERPQLASVFLDNNETLDLQWTLKSNGGIINTMAYAVEIYDEDESLYGSTDGAKMSFIVNGAALEDNYHIEDETWEGLLTTRDGTSGKITTKVTFYDKAGNTSGDPVNITFTAYVEKINGKETAHLFLDAIDYETKTGELEKDREGNTLLNASFSIQRFCEKLNLSTKLWARVQPISYRSGKWSNSGESDAMFAGRDDRAESEITYSIKNARHLYNTRFIEKAAAENTDSLVQKNNKFELISNITWGGSDGILAHNKVYDSSGVKDLADETDFNKKLDYVVAKDFKWNENEKEDGGLDVSTLAGKIESGNEDSITRSELEQIVFPSIYQIRAGDTITASGQRNMLSNFVFSSQEYEEGAYSAGLVCISEGTVENIRVQHTYVDSYAGISSADGPDETNYISQQNAGTVCGINKGTLHNIQVSNGIINGSINVGGIVGYSEEADTLNSLTNDSQVWGEENIGGICGKAYNVKEIASSNNNGLILAQENGTYIGGVVGLYQVDGDRDSGKIINCTNSNSVDLDLDKISDHQSLARTKLESCNYVGGIVGSGKNISIDGCKNKDGMIFGNQNVGGIAGEMQAAEGRTIAITKSENHAEAAGKLYVGGVIGRNINTSINECTNTGLIVATDRFISDGETGYAGGIAGFNSGEIRDSTTTVDIASQTGSELLNKTKEWSSNADYVGGIVGYNTGIITTEEEKDITSIVSGKNYVGGIIGCNAQGAEVNHYTLRGGYISGTNFVGGFIGLNGSDKIFATEGKMDESKFMMESRPSEIQGVHYVGGILGANVIITEGSEALYAKCSADNFLGKISSADGIYVGGFFGYNQLIQYVDSGENENTQLEKRAEQLITQVSGGVNADGISIDPKVPASVTDAAPANSSLTIVGTDGTGISLTAEGKLETISAGLYVGGIIGYNAHGSNLTIKDITNQSIVRATDKWIDEESTITSNISDLSAETVRYSYSYVGGIIGMAENTVTLDNCKNSGQGDAIGTGNFKGGLVEVNEGIIKNCSANSLETTDDSQYIGGIVGVNTSEGRLYGCDFPSGTVQGIDCVGGLAALNDGTIDKMQEDSDAFQIAGTVWGRGQNIGGVVGVNRGSIANGELTSNIENGSETTTVTIYTDVRDSQFNTNENAYILYNNNRPPNTYKTAGTVNSSSGNALATFKVVPGETYTIKLHMQTRFRVATMAQLKDGTSVNNYWKSDKDTNESKVWNSDEEYRITIPEGENYLLVFYWSGTAGGWESTWESLEILKEESHTVISGSTTIGGTGTNVGGFAGVNIDKGTLNNLSMQENKNIFVEGKANVGGFVGITKNNITGCINHAEIKASDGAAGGIAAMAGEEAAGEDKVTILECFNRNKVTAEKSGDAGGITSINFANAIIENCYNTGILTANNGDVGGLTGKNYGIIRGGGVAYEIEQKDDVTSSEEPGRIETGDSSNKLAFSSRTYTGGVAAVNSGASAYIENVTVANISLAGNAEKLGGIVGENQRDSKIKHCTVANSEISSTVNDSKLGGIAGTNEGEITGADNISTVSGTSLTANAGWLGGIAGTNTGVIQNYSFSGNITGNVGGSSYGYGGIAGTNKRSEPIANENTDSNVETSIENCFLTGTTTITATGSAADIVRIGGIAGINGTGANITGCLIAKDEGSNIKIGNHDNTYGYVGGIAGENDGNISKCIHTNYPMKSDNMTDEQYAEIDIETIQKELNPGNNKNANGGVTISANIGRVGGLIGTNQQNGLIEKSSTGDTGWLIQQKTGATDTVAGGIIGYNVSDQTINNLVNYAEVTFNSNTNSTGVGGIMGRHENTTKNGWVVRDCVNYGNITGRCRTGGLIGQWKYTGGTIERCINMGSITAYSEVTSDPSAGAAAAGMIGFIYPSTPVTLTLDSCENYGKIKVSSGLAAGIMGTGNTGNKIKLELNNCINAGKIEGAGGGSGIIAKIDYTSSCTITKCRNYGNGTNIFYAICRNGNPTILQSIGIRFGNSFTNLDSNSSSGNIYFTNTTTSTSPFAFQITGSGTTWQAENNSVDKVISGLPCDPTARTGYLTNGNKDNDQGVDNRSFTLAEIRSFEAAIAEYYDDPINNNKLNDPRFSVVQEGIDFVLTLNAPVVNAKEYEIKASIYDTKEAAEAKNSLLNTLTYTTGNLNYRINLTEYMGKFVVFSVQAKAEDSSVNSNIIDSGVFEIRQALPVPQVYIRVLKDNSTYKYQYILENVSDYGEGVSIEANIPNRNFSFNASDGKSDLFSTTGSDDGSLMVNVQAKIGSSYVSQMYSKNTSIASSGNNLYSKNLVNSANVTLTGTVASALSCTAEINRNGTPAYYRTDILVQDPNINNAWVVIKSGESAMIGNTKKATAQLSGINLEEVIPDIQNKGVTIKVRVYPCYSQERVIRYAYPVDEPFSCNINDPGALAKLNTWIEANGTTPYCIERNTKGQYVIELYSEYYDGNAAAPFPYTEKTLTLTKDNFETTPVISDQYEIVNGNYQFYWDQNEFASQKGPYQVVLAGIDQDGGEVELENQSKTENDKTLLRSKRGWEYRNAILKVSHVSSGFTTNFTNITGKLGTTASKEFEFKLPLDTIGRPSVSLINKNDLKYTLLWLGLTDTSQLDALKEYKITISDSDGNTSEMLTGSKDNNSFEIDFTKLLVRRGDTVVEENWQGKTVKISVQAIAKEDSITYTDSDPGVEREFTIPHKMDYENQLTLTPTDTTPVSGYNNEFELKINTETKVGDAIVTNGNFIFQASIYDSNSDGSISDTKLFDFTPNNTSISMIGNLQSSLYRFENARGFYVYNGQASEQGGIPVEYAGKWIRIRTRAVADSQISSNWSEWTDFKLPIAKLSKPQLLAGSLEQEWDASVTNGEQTEEIKVKMQNNTITWSEIDFTDYYKIVISPIDAEKIELTIRKGENDTVHVIVHLGEGEHWNSYDLSSDNSYQCAVEEYSPEIIFENAGIVYTIPLKTYLSYSKEDKTFTLTLPDDGSNTLYVPHLMTQQVTVQAYVDTPSEKEHGYESSEQEQWTRVWRTETINGSQMEFYEIMIGELQGWAMLDHKVNVEAEVETLNQSLEESEAVPEEAAQEEDVIEPSKGD